jgi:hypothetical protein
LCAGVWRLEAGGWRLEAGTFFRDVTQERFVMKIHALVLGILLMAAPAFAAAVDGKWTGSIDTPNGPVTVSFTFKSDGNSLTGTTTGPDGAEVPLKAGKIDGNNISFSVDLDFGGMPFTLAYMGVVSPDQIKLTADFMGMPFEFVVKKAS